MPIRVKTLDIFISLLVESLLVYLFLVPFGGGSNPWQFAEPFSIMLLSTVLLFLFLHFILKRENFFIYFVVSLAVCTLGIVIGLAIPLAFVTAMLFLWRLMDAINGHTLNQLWSVYMATVAITFLYMIVLGFLQIDFPHRSWFLIFFFVQTFLIVFLHFLKITKSGRFGKKMSLSYSVTFGGIILIAALFAAIGPYISSLIRFILEWVGIAVFYIFRVFWVLLMAIRSENFDEIWKSLQNGRQKNQQTDKWADLSNYHPPDSYTWAGILFVVVIELIFFYFLRKKWLWDKTKHERKELRHENFNGHFKQAFEKGGRKTKMKAPKNPVRLALFKLQKRLAKQKEGRITYETLGEWLGRLPKEEGDHSIIRHIYEKVRYGNKEVQKDELSLYEEAIRSMMKHGDSSASSNQNK